MKKTYCDMCAGPVADGLHMDIELVTKTPGATKAFHMDFDICDDCAEDYEGDTLGYLTLCADHTLGFTKES